MARVTDPAAGQQSRPTGSRCAPSGRDRRHSPARELEIKRKARGHSTLDHPSVARAGHVHSLARPARHTCVRGLSRSTGIGQTSCRPMLRGPGEAREGTASARRLLIPGLGSARAGTRPDRWSGQQGMPMGSGPDGPTIQPLAPRRGRIKSQRPWRPWPQGHQRALPDQIRSRAPGHGRLSGLFP
jgi:hypothetical protein